MDVIPNRNLTSKIDSSATWRLLTRFIFLAAFICFANTVWGDFLTQVQVVYDDENGVEGLDGAYSILVSPDGKHVYATGDWDHGIAVFKRNSLNGTLSFVEFEGHRSGAEDGLANAEGLSFSPGGKHLYVTNGDSVAVFSRNGSSGEISFAGYHDDDWRVFDTSASAVTPDGNYVIVTTLINGDSWTYKRDPTTGLLEFVGKWSFGSLSDLTHVAISPDGEYFYLSDSYEDMIGQFDLDKGTGHSDFVEQQEDGINGVDGLNGASSISISPEGDSLYVASPADFALSVFRRNKASGNLDYVEVQRDGVQGVDGIDGVDKVKVSPDGKFVYSVSRNDHAVAVFQRNKTDSSLSFLEAKNEQNGVVDSGLFDPSDLSVSPDSKFVYVTSYSSDAVFVFKTSGGGPPPAQGTFQINAGLNGSWYYPETDGQGFFIDVFPDVGEMFVAWFTFDTEQPDESVDANLGHPGQRWLTAQGEYADNQAVLDIYMSGGGLFDMRPPIPEVEKDGTLIIEFSDCRNGTVTYDIPSIGRQGIVPIVRIREDNVVLCESLDEITQALQ